MKELELFVRESNWIEGIRRDPSATEIDNHRWFLAKERIAVQDLVSFVAGVQRGAILRDKSGLDVYVGDHRPPPGSPDIRSKLCAILEGIQGPRRSNAFVTHQAYETLHPFTDGNGRSGRVLWLWMMGGVEQAPLGFLHHWYYQSLSNWRAK